MGKVARWVRQPLDEATPIARRLRPIIDRCYDGSVNFAARSWGMPQRTLARIVDGEIDNLRSDTLLILARATGASLDWLVWGKGEPPPDPPRRCRHCGQLLPAD